MKKLLGLLIFLAATAFANQRVQGNCEMGGTAAAIPPNTSTNLFQQSFPRCTVTVYLTGTLTLATVYSDNSNTPLGNPFTADTVGHWFFYAANGRYDVQLSAGQGGGFPSPITIGDVLLQDNATGGVITSVTGSSGISCNTVSGAVTCTNSGVTSFNGSAGAVTGLISFNGRTTAAAVPTSGDYTWSMIGGSKQGNTNVPQMAGTNSGAAGATLCNDASGNTTTSGCVSASSSNGPLPWSQSPSGSLSIGSNTVTLTPCPVGVNGSDADHWLYVSGGSAPTVLTLSSATAGTPIALTFSAPHGLSTGQFGTLATPAGLTWATGPWYVTNTGLTTVTLQNSAATTAATITSMTGSAVSPIVLGLDVVIGAQTGDQLTIASAAGNTAANGTFTVTKIDDSTYSLNGTTGNGTWTGTGTATLVASAPLGGGATFTVGPEAVKITGGTCTSGAASGTVTFTAVNPHSAGYTIASATAGITEAVNTAIANSQNQVIIPAGTYTLHGAIVPLPSAFTVAGAGPATILNLVPGAPSVWLFSSLGSAAASTTSGTTIQYSTRATNNPMLDTITVGSNAGMSVGTYLELFSGQDPTFGNYYEQFDPIQYINGTTVKLNDAIGIPLMPTFTPAASVTPVTMVSGVTIKDMVIDGGAGSQGVNRSGTNTVDLRGINWQWVALSRISNVQLKNWSATSAIYLIRGYGNTISDVSAIHSGSVGSNDLVFTYQTRMTLHNILSLYAEGFGPGPGVSTYMQATNISVEGPAARALKVSACAWCQFTNINTTRSQDNGLGIAGGTYRSSFNHITALNNHGFEGVWLGSSDSQQNTFDDVQACGNGLNGTQDISLFSGDHDNTLSNVRLCGAISNGSATANNLVRFAEPYFSAVTNSALQSIANNALQSVTWDTNVRDTGGVHSTSINPSRFTIPAPQGCTSNACGWTEVTGQLCYAGNATGSRSAEILKNGATTLSFSILPAAPVTQETCVPVAAMVLLQDSDYIEIQAFQNSGGALNLDGVASGIQVKRVQ